MNIPKNKIKIMNKILLSIIIITVILISGCSDNWQGKPITYKNIDSAVIPQKCLEFQGDACGLFSCMINNCWCDDSSPDLPLIYKNENIVLKTDQEAISYVQKYIDEKNLGYEVKTAFALNNIFFNVFADNNGDEVVYTITVDGTILKTICGV